MNSSPWLVEFDVVNEFGRVVATVYRSYSEGRRWSWPCRAVRNHYFGGGA